MEKLTVKGFLMQWIQLNITLKPNNFEYCEYRAECKHLNPDILKLIIKKWENHLFNKSVLNTDSEPSTVLGVKDTIMSKKEIQCLPPEGLQSINNVP